MPNPITKEIDAGRWLPGFQAQDKMLYKFGKENNIEKMDWRPKMYKQLKKEQ